MRRLFSILLWGAVLCQAQAPQGDTFKFESKVNVVVVPVLVRDSHGKAVGTLTKENFQVFDKDKLQTITGFTIQKRSLASRAAPSAAAAPSAVSSPAALPERVIVFLFDDLHLETADLAMAKKAAVNMLAGSLGEGDMAAVVSMSGSINSGMIRDRAKLAEAIMNLREVRTYRPLGRPCPEVSYYQADLIQNKNDARALDAAVQEAFACANLDTSMQASAEQMARQSSSQALIFGEQGTRVTLQVIRNVVKKMGTLPGQHLLILVSPGFLGMTPEALTEKSQIMDTAAQANVTISTLDARGLYVADFDATQSTAGPPIVSQMKSQYQRDSMSANEDVMAELADGTGGTYFHNNNDLGAGFHALTQSPEFIYLLEFVPHDVKQDGAYHRLKVKLNQDGLKLQARRGYFAPKASKKKNS